MSTHKSIEKVCIIITVIAVLFTALFMNGEKLGIAADDSVSLGYVDKLFDDSYVHTINIEIDDWESLLENATSEEYSAANVTIDGETVKNVGIRAKGNTSLSTVSQLDSDRYSFKIEFDCYQYNNTYYGLDKLCLNNLIQDYTMMKDYLAYKLMNEFGVSAPLVSFTFITVNGEDWGLYLAVEAVENSFLERNYGTNYGELYKPDTMSMGGGRGNGGGFDMREMDFDQLGIQNPFETSDGEVKSPEDMTEEELEEFKEKMEATGFGGPGGNDGDAAGSDSSDESGDSKSFGPPGDFGGGPGGGGPGDGGPGGFGMGSDDSKLKYSDDDIDSYSNIFDSAKTKISKADKKRLIKALKAMNEGLAEGDADEIASAVDIDAVLRYMVVHNFVVNGDSYTGSMIHNFYLYEEDGQLSMIPWDYNLAYGTFQAQDSDGAVNDPIDTPLSISEGDTDRPMFSWIMSCDEYTEMYHEYFQDFLDQFYASGYITDLIDTTYEMISEYVDRDPTKFCTTQEFEKAVDTMRTFVELRCESIQGQLEGTIGSTDAEQEANPDALIDASSISLSDMGSMGGGGGPGGDSDSHGPGGHGGHVGHSRHGGNSDSDSKKSGSDSNGGHSKNSESGSQSEDSNHGDSAQSSSSENSDSATEEKLSEEASADGQESGFPGGGFPGGDSEGGFPGGDFPGGDFAQTSNVTTTDWIYTGACAAVLLAAILFALKFKNRK